MFISDAFDKSNTARILRVDAVTGNVSAVISSPAINYVGQLAFSTSGDIYFSTWRGNLGNVTVKLAAGTYTPSVFATGSFLSPNGLVFDGIGNLYAADGDRNKIYKIDVSGTVTVFAGTGIEGSAGNDGPASSAQIAFPFQLAFDSAGDLYVVATRSHSVRKITMSTGIISTVAGTPGQLGYTGDGGPAALATLYYPYGLAFDSSDNM